MSTRHTFTGNPATNDAGRYSMAMAKYRAALEHWQRNGCSGPKPVQPIKPASLQPASDTAPSQAELKRRAKAEAARREAAKPSLF